MKNLEAANRIMAEVATEAGITVAALVAGRNHTYAQAKRRAAIRLSTELGVRPPAIARSLGYRGDRSVRETLKNHRAGVV